MGYECPVCATPQSDARHLANHMAFTAVLGDEAHETWLDEHAPGWGEAGEAELAPRVAEHAPEGEFAQVFEDTAGGLEEDDPTDPPGERSGALFDDDVHTHTDGDDHDHGHRHGHGIPLDPDHAGKPARDDRTAHLAGGVDPAELDEETREVLEEARELTREMLVEEAGDEEAGEAEEAGAGREETGDADASGDEDGDTN